MGVDELARLLGKMEPQDIESRHGAELDVEARAYFDAFKRTCAQLDQLSDYMEANLPPAPVVRKVSPLVRFLNRRIASPAWSYPLAAAALICVGLVLPHSSERKVETEVPAPSLLEPMRAGSVPEMDVQNARIADAFVERAQELQARREFALAWQDYVSALGFLSEDDQPQRDQLLEEMQIIAESLHDDAKLKQVLSLRPAPR